MARLALLLALVAVSQCSLSCLDESGKAVDWWAKFKLPNSRKYMYADANSQSLEASEEDLSSGQSALWRTVNGGRNYASETAYAYYNDETPDEVQKGSRAHAKGIFYTTSAGNGFWLIHSVPRFPELKETTFPDDEIIYGQSFLCISISSKAEWANLGTNLLINFPQIYEHSFPSWFSAFAPDFDKILGTSRPDGIADYATAKLLSGFFLAFAKDSDWADDLFGALVAPTLKVNMACETWMRPAMDPACGGKYTVVNVKEVTFPGQEAFTETQDHSKWGVSTSSAKPYVCIGDINRMISQRKRGGGTVCFQSPDLWKSLSSSITDKDSC